MSNEMSGVDYRSLNEFKAVYEQVDYMSKSLYKGELFTKELSEVEHFILNKGTELLKGFLQSYLDRRKATEVNLGQVTGTDGLERNHIKEDCERTIESLFGEVQVKRLGYNKYGSQNLHPLDAQLNLPQDNYSYCLKKRVAQEVIRGSVDQALKSVQNTTGGKVPKRQALGMMANIAQDFEAFYQTRQANSPEQTEDLLTMSLDSKGIVMRPEGLTESTRKAAQKDKDQEVRTGLWQSKERNHKRMATVATVYTAEKDVRSAELIMRLLKKDKEEEKKPEGKTIVPFKPRAKRAQNKRVWASLKRKASTVTEEVFQEALRRDPKNSREWVVVIDGDEHQLGNIKHAIKRHQIKNVTIVLDFIHAIEYVWEAARAFGFEGKEAASWVDERVLKILHGKVSAVAAGMRRSATLRKLNAAACKRVGKSVDYLLKYAFMMQYDQYLASGFPIASGAIEGACRHLIKDRMDITGARWGLEGAEAVIKLRSLNSSHDFDAYWEYHLRQSFQRIHLPRYQNTTYLRAA